MSGEILQKKLQVADMTCPSCETRIGNALKKHAGIKEVKADYRSSSVYIAYDPGKVRLSEITEIIEKLGYTVINKSAKEDELTDTTGNKKPAGQLLGIGIILLALYFIINNTVGLNFMPEANQSMGYSVLFVVGLLTSAHCLAMCGGINLSQCVSYSNEGRNSGIFGKLKPSLLYNCGRVISYTVIGGMAGALGSVVSLSGAARGIVVIISGLLMTIVGLNMLNIFPLLRKVNPRMPRGISNKLARKSTGYGPFYIGLLNGLMPCGPLQTMQLYALGTGNFITGALSMFFFSLGTVPLMFGLGSVSTMLSKKFTKKMVKISAVIVIVLGMVILNRGLVLSGFTFPSFLQNTNNYYKKASNVAVIQDGIQVITTRLSPGSYEPIVVQKGIPVKWVIKARARDINGCNNEIIIPRFNIGKKLEEGENIIEFIPQESGTYVYSCWMGMIRSKITVVDDISEINQRIN